MKYTLVVLPLFAVAIALTTRCSSPTSEKTDGSSAGEDAGVDGSSLQYDRGWDGGVLPHYQGGYHLYSWKSSADSWCYNLVPGFDRQRFRSELGFGPTKPETQIKITACSVGELGQALAQLPDDESVSWLNDTFVMGKGDLQIAFPDESTIAAIVQSAQSVGVRLMVVR